MRTYVYAHIYTRIYIHTHTHVNQTQKLASRLDLSPYPHIIYIIKILNSLTLSEYSSQRMHARVHTYTSHSLADTINVAECVPDFKSATLDAFLPAGSNLHVSKQINASESLKISRNIF